eukprot:TRINITY_DN12683_c0_g4_i3.p2 TRINITY_DN12683_c0_g4~~TRINITY_DN12683_c0_g4_i3.p2  ORF type:complete len:124 (-),score=43.65 TRINITY_DN12683_c0_g4_i3:142-513(-)
MILGLFVAVFFGLMVLGPFLTAIYSAMDNQSVWEAGEDVYGVELGARKGLAEAMGDDSVFFWLFPVTPTLHVNYMQQVYKLEDVNRKKPEEEPKYYPRAKVIRSIYEVALWILAVSASIYFVR